MPFQAGTATTTTDLLQQLVTFLVANGWTTDLSAAEGLGWRAHLHKSANYVHLRASENEHVWQNSNGNANGYSLNLYLGTAFTGANAWNNQLTGSPVESGDPTKPVGAAMVTSAGPFSNYYFFTDATSDNVVIVVERTSGLFVYVGWGLSLVKAGVWTGGPYFFGSTSGYFANTAAGGLPGFGLTSECPGCNSDPDGAPVVWVRADVDSFTGKWISLSPVISPTLGYTGKTGGSSVFAIGGGSFSLPPISVPAYAAATANYFQSQQTSLQDGRANLLPILLWVLRDGTTTGFSPLGTIPNVFVSNGVGNGFSNASDYVIGAKTYRMFSNFAVAKQ